MDEIKSNTDRQSLISTLDDMFTTYLVSEMANNQAEREKVLCDYIELKKLIDFVYSNE